MDEKIIDSLINLTNLGLKNSELLTLLSIRISGLEKLLASDDLKKYLSGLREELYKRPLQHPEIARIGTELLATLENPN